MVLNEFLLLAVQVLQSKSIEQALADVHHAHRSSSLAVLSKSLIPPCRGRSKLSGCGRLNMNDQYSSS